MNGFTRPWVTSRPSSSSRATTPLSTESFNPHRSGGKPGAVQYRYRIVAAFEVADYAFLEALINKAVHAVTTTVKEIGEEAVFKHIRLIGAITCPDPDRHPDVVKHCLWPLLSGPFKEMLEDSIAAEMRTWLRNAYPVVPAG